MKRPRKPSLPKRRNPLARLIRQAPFGTRRKESRKAHARKPKHPKPPDVED
jgi:hypothetical protein